MTPARRQQLARIGAPAAFLLAVTIAAVLVRSSLRDDVPQPAPRDAVSQTTTRRAAPRVQPLAPETGATTAAPSTGTYVIESGDTLETIAAEHDATVERLLELNPGVDPVSLRVGQRLRVPAE